MPVDAGLSIARFSDDHTRHLSLWSGAPIRIMTESDEQELHEFMRLKHHSNGLKNQHLS
jgi:hypothetical protein